MSLSENSVHDRTTSSGSNVVYRHHHTTETHKQTSSCETRLETSSYNRTKLPMLSLQTENTHAHTHTHTRTNHSNESLPHTWASSRGCSTHSLTRRATNKKNGEKSSQKTKPTLTHSLTRSCKIDFRNRSSGQSKPPPPPISSRLSHLQSPAIDASPKIETNSCSLLH